MSTVPDCQTLYNNVEIQRSTSLHRLQGTTLLSLSELYLNRPPPPVVYFGRTYPEILGRIKLN